MPEVGSEELVGTYIFFPLVEAGIAGDVAGVYFAVLLAIGGVQLLLRIGCVHCGLEVFSGSSHR